MMEELWYFSDLDHKNEAQSETAADDKRRARRQQRGDDPTMPRWEAEANSDAANERS